MPSIAACLNVYQDVLALRGCLEQASRYFDNIFVIHSGPGGAFSTDGTIELCEQFGIKPTFASMDAGYGVIRTRLIQECGCEWGMILDADERFYPEQKVLHCEGNETWDLHRDLEHRPNLTVTVRDEVCRQGDRLKQLIADPRWQAIRSTRRHWLDFSMKHPSQNWLHNKDHQLRIVRNDPQVGYMAAKVMHENIIDYRTGREPIYAIQDDYQGPFHEHFHPFFRRTQLGHKQWNEANYQRLERREPMIPREVK